MLLGDEGTEKQHVDPENLVLSLTRLRDFLVEMDVKELSLPVSISTRSKQRTTASSGIVRACTRDIL